jgi:lysozyme
MIGRYGSEKPFIKGMGKYTIWQNSQTGKLTGIPKYVDIGIFREGVQIDDVLLAK